MSRDGTRPVSQVEVETALLQEVEHLEALTNGGRSPKLDADEVLTGYDAHCTDAAEAEATWKIEFAKGMILQASNGNKERKDIQEARVMATKADLYRAYKVSAAVKDGHKEALVTSRSRIDALRTIAANVRAQT